MQHTFFYLGQCFDAAKGADDKTEGFKRNKELIERYTTVDNINIARAPFLAYN